MSRDTLPRGTSLLALAGSTTARGLPAASTPLAEPVQSVATRRIVPAYSAAAKPRGEEIADGASVMLGPRHSRKHKVNARISGALLEEVRDCVVALSGPPHGLTMDAFAEEAYRRELERLRRSRNSGQPFALRPYNPKPGRRVG
jgi:hypothetical protein